MQCISTEKNNFLNISATIYSHWCVIYMVLLYFFSAIQCPRTIVNGQLSDSCSLGIGSVCTSANCSYGYENSLAFSISCSDAGTWDADTTALCTGLYIEDLT